MFREEPSAPPAERLIREERKKRCDAPGNGNRAEVYLARPPELHLDKKKTETKKTVCPRTVRKG